MFLMVLALAWCLMSLPFGVLVGRGIAAAGATLAEAEAAQKAGESVAYNHAQALA